MSQNDALLREKGLPVLTKSQKDMLIRQKQAETWDDMITSLNSYGKYIMLRPTGFGKTYTCACACNIGETKKYNRIVLNNGAKITNPKLLDICNKKVIFVYVSEVLKNTFAEYDTDSNRLIKTDANGDSRIIYESYAMLSKHWMNKDYLLNEMDINNVGLVIFDEVQRMGAKETAKALDIAIHILEKLKIPYIGATATVERATGDDVCEKYFTYKHSNTEKTYCWGENFFTLSNAFESGLLIPPEYQYIEEDADKIKKARQTRLSMLQELKAELVNTNGNNPEDKNVRISDIKELERAVIKNSSKIIHDTMVKLYDCDEPYLNNKESLEKAEFNSLSRPEKLPKYMRFLVFTPDRASMSNYVKTQDGSTLGKVFGGMVKQTHDDFLDAFGRYGYKIRTTIISSSSSTEKRNVRLISVNTVTEEDIESGRAVLPEDMTIDLIFSINMLNVGYHVDHLTGLVLKRWTGSNQIFYQQLGRCLSAKSDIIPVVFDFVKSIDSRGITAPMFTSNQIGKKVTENADGTQNTLYNTTRTINRNTVNIGDELELDNEGNPLDPRKCNTIDAKYITVSMTSASVYDIMKRQEVYLERKNAKSLYEKSYKLYTDLITTQNNVLTSNVNKVMSLATSLDIGILKMYPGVKPNQVTKNFKAYLEYLMLTGKTVYIADGAIINFLKEKSKGVEFSSITHEINSILAIAETYCTSGAKVKLLVKNGSQSKFLNYPEIIDILTKLKIDPNNDIVLYA